MGKSGAAATPNVRTAAQNRHPVFRRACRKMTQLRSPLAFAAGEKTAPQFGSTFFMITGFHGTHVSIGVIFLFIIARKVWRGDYDADNDRRGFFTSRKGKYEIVEITGLYWHFVDLVWVFIFALFYLW